MYCKSFWVPQSRHDVSSGFVCDSEGRHWLVAACDPEQDFRGPVVSHGVNHSHSVACQNLLDWECKKRTYNSPRWYPIGNKLTTETKCVHVISLCALVMVLSDKYNNIIKIYQSHWGWIYRRGLWTCRCRKWLLRWRQTPQQNQRKTPRAPREEGWCPPGGTSWVGFPAHPERWPSIRSPSPLFIEWNVVVTSRKRYLILQQVLYWWFVSR